MKLTMEMRQTGEPQFGGMLGMLEDWGVKVHQLDAWVPGTRGYWGVVRHVLLAQESSTPKPSRASEYWGFL